MPAGIRVAGGFDDDIAALPGRALAGLSNRRIEQRLDREILDLRSRARRGEFEGLDVAAFKVRELVRIPDLDITRIRRASVEVVKVAPDLPGFPAAFTPQFVLAPDPFRTLTISDPIIIRRQNPIRLQPLFP